MQYEFSDIYVIVVIYNKNYADSYTLKPLMNIKNINVIVVDNSTSNFNNSSIAKIPNFEYINMNGNQGLSKAYNAAIKRIKKYGKLVCIFDDDTNIEEDYFKTALSYINSNLNSDIYLPIVKDNHGILSPSCLKKVSYCRIKDTDEITSENVSAINSGMIIKSEIFENYKYDENLFLDFIDHDFIRTMKLKEKKIAIMNDNVITQNFSIINDSVKKAKIRYKIKKKDLKYFYKNHLMVYYYIIFKHKIGLCYFQKSIKPLFW